MPSTDPPIDAADDELIGAVLAERYKVLEAIGEGGMGRVYRGVHVTLGKAIALKVLKGEFTGNRDLTERFFREARAASRIGHENIVDIIDFGTTPAGEAYFVMEYLNGRELEELMGELGRLPWARARGVFIQIARAMTAAHRSGVIHRDMKPSNVFLVARDGNPDYVKLFDFGIAKIDDMAGLTRAGMVFGTVAYMAPEQAMAEDVDNRTDIYAVGCMAFEVLTGRLPFDDRSSHKVLDMHVEAPVPSLQATAPDAAIPDAVERIVRKAMAKAPDDRFQDMAELERALLAVPTEASASGGPSRRKRPPRPEVRRAPLSSQKLVTSPPSDVDGLRVPVPPELPLLATLYVALAGADGSLDPVEADLVLERLHEWDGDIPRREIGRLVRHTLADFAATRTSTTRVARTRECAASLRRLLPRPQLAAVLADLYEIAGVDGKVPDTELRFIVTVTKQLGLSPDPRLLATAFLYLALSHADGVFAPEEERVLIEQLQTWAPEASDAEIKTVLRWATAEFDRRGSRDEQLDCAREAADQLRLNAGDEALRRILGDLWRIAGADGHIATEEQQFIMDMVDRFAGR